jgi:hypothetical protein
MWITDLAFTHTKGTSAKSSLTREKHEVGNWVDIFLIHYFIYDLWALVLHDCLHSNNSGSTSNNSVEFTSYNSSVNKAKEYSNVQYYIYTRTQKEYSNKCTILKKRFIFYTHTNSLCSCSSPTLHQHTFVLFVWSKSCYCSLFITWNKKNRNRHLRRILVLTLDQ